MNAPFSFPMGTRRSSALSARRVPRHGPTRLSTRRSIHEATAVLSLPNREGPPLRQRVSVNLGGDPDVDAYVLVEPQVGRLLLLPPGLSSSPSLSALDPAARLDEERDGESRVPLRFWHDGHVLTSATSISPRSPPHLRLPQDLARPGGPRGNGGDARMSPATLYRFGRMHKVALDGTADAAYVRALEAEDQMLRGLLEMVKERGA